MPFSAQRVNDKGILILLISKSEEQFGTCITKLFKIANSTVALLGIYAKELSEIYTNIYTSFNHR